MVPNGQFFNDHIKPREMKNQHVLTLWHSSEYDVPKMVYLVPLSM